MQQHHVLSRSGVSTSALSCIWCPGFSTQVPVCFIIGSWPLAQFVLQAGTGGLPAAADPRAPLAPTGTAAYRNRRLPIAAPEWPASQPTLTAGPILAGLGGLWAPLFQDSVMLGQQRKQASSQHRTSFICDLVCSLCVCRTQSSSILSSTATFRVSLVSPAYHHPNAFMVSSVTVRQYRHLRQPPSSKRPQPRA